MRFIAKVLVLVLIATTLALAQSNLPQIQHVIVVIQENRTPDNLFGSDAFANQHQLPGADLVQSGQCYTTAAPHTIPLQPLSLGNTCNPDHSHQPAWMNTYHSGAMDGACTINAYNCGTTSNPEYTYVNGSNVAPYFNIAKQYGYANYFFQTNQGPSFPAHQFLFSGTSAPTYNDNDSNQYWKWFAAENSNSNSETDYGCTVLDTIVLGVDPNGSESNGYNNGSPCYNHNALVDLLDPVPISWRYYAQKPPTATSLWTAPDAISDVCVASTANGGECTGADWVNNVQSVFPYAAGYPASYSPILTDLGADLNQRQCTLPTVSWVVPDGNWSDHGGQDPAGEGPSWVSAIVNAVGGYDNSNHKLPTNCGYWANTVVLITWDDWGGWYDHVLPWRCSPATGCLGYDNGSGGVGGEYVYGFRVPLLVVSAYAKQGYISGKLPSPGEVQPYIHDFGSILNFIEYAFGQGGKPLGEVSPNYHYADHYAPDAPNTPGCNPTLCPYSLRDFFDFANQHTFTPFTQGLRPTQCFLTPTVATCFGTNFAGADPDDDAVNP
jgi:phospholipase C